jgi:rod shape-determining protein MreC
MHRTSPPPFFNQGPSAHARLALFALLAVAMLVVDARLGLLAALRQGVGTVLYPLERALLVPRDAIALARDYLGGMDRLRAESVELRRIETANAKALLEAEQLTTENARLRDLMGARERVAIRSVIAEVLYDTRDPYTRKLVVDRGLQHGLLAGQPVIDANGVVGQVTRVLPLSSEVTLLTDRNSTLPVEVSRTGQRSIAFGGDASGLLELRFLNAGTDLTPGDALVTSGLDGVFPAGLPVGSVERIEPAGVAASYARVLVRPVARVDETRMMLVLMVDSSALPPPPPPDPEPAPRKRRSRG